MRLAAPQACGGGLNANLEVSNLHAINHHSGCFLYFQRRSSYSAEVGDIRLTGTSNRDSPEMGNSPRAVITFKDPQSMNIACALVFPSLSLSFVILF